MPTPPILYSAESAAQLLGISRSTIYRLIQTGQLKSVRVGRARRFTRQALDDLVAVLEAAAAETP